MDADITLVINGDARSLTIDTRTTVLDALRERLGIISAKKGCDHGQCGACTVLMDGRRVNSCLTLAVAHDGASITTAEGLAADAATDMDADPDPDADTDPDGLHPMQRSFLDCDALQCGYCTPGQVVSAVGMLTEAQARWPSHVTGDLDADEVVLDAAEIRERMSGNLCRCGAYANIVEAIAQVAEGARG